MYNQCKHFGPAKIDEQKVDTNIKVQCSFPVNLKWAATTFTSASMATRFHNEDELDRNFSDATTFL